ncbi:MAG TPA: hypothetical protein VK173_07775, partial [Lacibacter sp.]|nr:hypothetical protein [Lacibacter sp.]
MAIGNLVAAFKLLFSGDFKGAKEALTREIVTPSSKALDELSKKHKLTQDEFKMAAMTEMKTIGTNYNMIGLKKKAGGAVDATTANIGGGFKPGGASAGGNDAGATSRAKDINNGGARAIIINIAKQVGVEEIHVLSGKDALNEIEQSVKEVMRRVLYSANGQTTAAS